MSDVISDRAMVCQAVCGKLLLSYGLPLKVDWHLIKAANMLTCSLGCLSIAQALLMYIRMLCSVICCFCIKHVSLLL